MGVADADPDTVLDEIIARCGLDGSQGGIALNATQRTALRNFLTNNGSLTTLDLTTESDGSDAQRRVRGTIALALRPDVDDRPRQVVDPEHGKPAITDWQVDRVEAAAAGDVRVRTRVLFTPRTRSASRRRSSAIASTAPTPPTSRACSCTRSRSPSRTRTPARSSSSRCPPRSDRAPARRAGYNVERGRSCEGTGRGSARHCARGALPVDEGGRAAAVSCGEAILGARARRALLRRV
jgi:hypothetical protein